MRREERLLWYLRLKLMGVLDLVDITQADINGDDRLVGREMGIDSI